ncbi:hypothetical protein QUB80_01035 [Chlorogloeopsis sp. ULAP01]|nr:hypothetical protein [Chlorogloeopsis sp. ULAP01]MDM9379293.1 hypothetical protein [Chlorogloeopsis sp. ULAP01]
MVSVDSLTTSTTSMGGVSSSSMTASRLENASHSLRVRSLLLSFV